MCRAQLPFNGNFEFLDSAYKPVGWDLTFYGQNTYAVKLDSLEKCQGKYAISISSGNSKAGYGAINFPIHQRYQGKTLTLIGNIKTEGITDGWAGIWIRTEKADGSIFSFNNMEKNGITGTHTWKEYVQQVRYDGDEVATINIGALLAGKGKMWLDSVRLYLDDTPIDSAAINHFSNSPALKDTAFSTSSGIGTIIVNRRNIKYLTLLGQLWGFLKYYHPAIATGAYNWDAELFRILPSVVKCRTDSRFAALMEEWVDKLGKPTLCTDCLSPSKMKDVSLMPDYGSLFSNPVFSRSLIQKLAYIRDNSKNEESFYVAMAGTSGENPVFKHEISYDNREYPDAGYRLLTLYRYWNIIQYFSPNRKLITEGWGRMLQHSIPAVIGAGNSFDYTEAMVKLIVTTHDTHSFIQSSVWEKYLGAFRVPFQARFIENKLVVTGYYKDTLQVKQHFKIGDVITSIGGIPVERLVKKYSLLIPASNNGATLRDMPGLHLLRGRDSLFNFTLTRNKQKYVIHQTAVSISKTDFGSLDWNADSGKPGYYLINNDIGYVFAGRYKNSALDSLKDRFENTKGIILDMRCYPSDEMENTLGDFIKPGRSEFVKFTRGSVRNPGLFVFDPGEKNGSDTSGHYKGRVVVIVNSMTQSNAEFVTMAFQSSSNVFVIGSASSGADGNISEIPLPGITTYLSGLGVYYPDGVNAQRSGVKINYHLSPTIEGVINGRDELLEKAEQIIMGEAYNSSPFLP
jgi:C-terminal processing protease CtpA/Prc